MFHRVRRPFGGFLVLAIVAALSIASPFGHVAAQDASKESRASTPEAERVHDGSREDPIPRGQSAQVGDWEVEIVGWKRSATDVILAENMFNDPPADGMTFAMVTVLLKYTGEETGSPGDLRVRAVGKANVGRDDGDCGVIPNVYYEVPEVFPGGEVKVNWCFAVPVDDAPTLLVYFEDAWDFDAEPVFFDPVKKED